MVLVVTREYVGRPIPVYVVTEVDDDQLTTWWMEDSHMGYGATEEVDAFLDDLAEVLAGTPFDGQMVEYDWDLGQAIGHHIFLKGRRIEVSFQLIIAPVRDVKVGEKYRATVEVEVIGLPDNKVVIVGP